MKSIKLTRAILSVFVFAALALLTNAVNAGEEGAIWSAFNLTEYKKGAFSTKTHAELRFDDMTDLNYYRIAQKLGYKFNGTWSGVMALTMENKRSDSGFPWNHTYRLELEMNPTLVLNDNTKWKMRNRLELRQKEGKGGEMYNRFRHRSLISLKSSALPSMTSYDFGVELFYDFKADSLNLIRYIPVQLSFKLSDNTKLSTYYLYQSKKGASDWSGLHVLGTGLSWSF